MANFLQGIVPADQQTAYIRHLTSNGTIGQAQEDGYINVLHEQEGLFQVNFLNRPIVGKVWPLSFSVEEDLTDLQISFSLKYRILSDLKNIFFMTGHGLPMNIASDIGFDDLNRVNRTISDNSSTDAEKRSAVLAYATTVFTSNYSDFATNTEWQSSMRYAINNPRGSGNLQYSPNNDVIPDICDADGISDPIKPYSPVVIKNNPVVFPITEQTLNVDGTQQRNPITPLTPVPSAQGPQTTTPPQSGFGFGGILQNLSNTLGQGPSSLGLPPMYLNLNPNQGLTLVNLNTGVIPDGVFNLPTRLMALTPFMRLCGCPLAQEIIYPGRNPLVTDTPQKFDPTYNKPRGFSSTESIFNKLTFRYTRLLPRPTPHLPDGGPVPGESPHPAPPGVIPDPFPNIEPSDPPYDDDNPGQRPKQFPQDVNPFVTNRRIPDDNINSVFVPVVNPNVKPVPALPVFTDTPNTISNVANPNVKAAYIDPKTEYSDNLLRSDVYASLFKSFGTNINVPNTPDQTEVPEALVDYWGEGDVFAINSGNGPITVALDGYPNSSNVAGKPLMMGGSIVSNNLQNSSDRTSGNVDDMFFSGIDLLADSNLALNYFINSSLPGQDKIEPSDFPDGTEQRFGAFLTQDSIDLPNGASLYNNSTQLITNFVNEAFKNMAPDKTWMEYDSDLTIITNNNLIEHKVLPKVDLRPRSITKSVGTEIETSFNEEVQFGPDSIREAEKLRSQYWLTNPPPDNVIQILGNCSTIIMLTGHARRAHYQPIAPILLRYGGKRAYQLYRRERKKQVDSLSGVVYTNDWEIAYVLKNSPAGFLPAPNNPFLEDEVNIAMQKDGFGRLVKAIDSSNNQDAYLIVPKGNETSIPDLTGLNII